MSTADAGSKRIRTYHGETTVRDVTGHWPEPVTTDVNGDGEFKCKAGSVSVWCPV